MATPEQVQNIFAIMLTKHSLWNPNEIIGKLKENLSDNVMSESDKIR